MATIPLPARGVDITLVQLTMQNVNPSSGLLSDSTTVAQVTAKLQSLRANFRFATEDFSAITQFEENNIPISHGGDVSITEIHSRVASALPATGPSLAKFVDLMTVGSLIAKLVWTVGGNTTTWTASLTGWEPDHSGKGKQLGTATFAHVDIGSPNPVYS